MIFLLALYKCAIPNETYMRNGDMGVAASLPDDSVNTAQIRVPVSVIWLLVVTLVSNKLSKK